MHVRELLIRYDVALMLRATAPREQARVRSIGMQRLSGEGEILQAHADLGHRISDIVLRRRLVNELQFVVALKENQLAASTWIARGERYIDELNWLMPIGPDELWVRDVYVAPAWRGRRLFTEIAACLADGGDGTSHRVWSDVDWANEGSMRAHQAAGFRIVARVWALDFAGRVRLRSAAPSWPLPIQEIDPASRLVWLRGRRLQRHRELLA